MQYTAVIRPWVGTRNPETGLLRMPSTLERKSRVSQSAYPHRPIMLVDDEPQALTSFEMTLRSAGMNNFICCRDSREVMSILAREEMEIMLLDLWMPHVSGEELLRQISADYPDLTLIIITGADDVETAVRCVREGVFDYIVKPVERARLISSVRRAMELRELHRENRALKARVLSDRLTRPEAFSEIVTISARMRSIFRYMEAIAPSPRPMLITGEPGVGKRLVARAVHTLSRRTGPFVAVNVSGLDNHMFADALFGHRKDAFNGALEARAGLLEQAASGTLFLDEIGDLGPSSQVRLLRLLQDRAYFPLGSDLAKRSDASIVAATTHDLEAGRNSGTFRRDLHHRLSGHHIHVPPLRERREDLPVLLDYFLEKASGTLGKQRPTPPDELIELLVSYHFPGNVRELESMVHNAVSSHTSGELSMDAFKAKSFQKTAGPGGG
jgi:DNA-binding NtrC family response regulator